MASLAPPGYSYALVPPLKFSAYATDCSIQQLQSRLAGSLLLRSLSQNGTEYMCIKNNTVHGREKKTICKISLNFQFENCWLHLAYVNTFNNLFGLQCALNFLV